MPVIEVPNVGEVEFPDTMSEADIVQAIERDILPPSHSAQTAIPEPGEPLPTLKSPLTSVPQAFPAVEQAREETAKLPSLTAEEAEQMLTTPIVQLPRPGAPGTVGRGISEVGAGLVEQALLTPASGILATTALVPGLRAGLGAVASAGATKAAAEKLGEASVTGDKQAITEGIGLATLAALGGTATGIDIAKSRPGVWARELINENRTKPIPPPEVLGPEPRAIAPESRQLPAPRTRMPEFSQSTIEPEGPPLRRLPAPGETEGSVLLPESQLGPRTEGYRIALPVEPEAAALARQRWSKPIDIEAQVEGVDALRQMVSITDEVKSPGKPYEPPSVNVDLRQLERMMQRNTVSKVESWADQVIRDRLSGTSANPFLDPELLAAASVKGAILIKRGVTDFAKWSDEMRKQFGVGLHDKLPAIYSQSVKYWNEGSQAPVATPQSDPLAKSTITPGVFDPAATVTPKEKTLGITPGPAKVSKQLGEELADIGRRWFTVRGNLPPEVQALKLEREGAISKADLDIKLSTQRLMDALSEHYKIGSVARAGGGSRKIPQPAVEAMDAYLKGQVANPASIPAPIRGALDTMRAEINAWSQKVSDKLMTQAGRFKQGSPEWTRLTELADKINNNMDVYVHRSYRFFDSKKSGEKWYDDLPLGLRKKAEDLLISRDPTLTQAQAQSKLMDWLSDLRDESTGGTGGRLGAKDLSIFMRRKVLDPEIKAVLGEYKSPLINYTKSISKMARWLADQKFLEDVKARGMGTFLFEEGQNPPGFNTLIAGEGSDTMSPLNGLRTSDVIAQAFKEKDSFDINHPVARAYLMLNGWTKFAATALSPLTQARNLGSRPWMSTWAGHWDATVVPEAFRLIKSEIQGRATPADKATLARARELGVFEGSGQSAEIMQVMKDASLQDVAPGDLYSWSMLRALRHYGHDVPAKYYRASDNLGSLVGWLNETKTQQRINPSWSLAEAQAEAAKVTRRIYPYYSETPKAIKSFRAMPVGPFVTFPYQMVRVMWNGVAQSLKEIRSANPIEQSVGRKRLASQIATISGVYALQEMGKAYWNISTQQEDDFRRFQPKWSRNSKWLFTGKNPDEGELQGINLSYTDPFSYATDPVVAAMRSLRTGDDLFDVFAETTREMLSPYVSEQMLAKAIIEARNGKTDSGREIFNPTDDRAEVFAKRLDHVANTLLPGGVQRLQRRIIPAARNEQPIYGRKLELGPEIARELTGVAIEKFNFKNGLAYKTREFKEGDTASEDVFRDVVSRTQTTTEADMLEAYRKSDERRFQVWQEMRKDFLAAVRNGVSVPEAMSLMTSRGIAQRDAELISAGVYQPNEVSRATMQSAARRGRVIPEAEIRIYQAERRGMSLDEQAAGEGR